MMMMADDLYLVEVGQAFVVLVSEGSYPNFPAGADEDGKKRETAAFIKHEKAIKTADVMKELLRNLILEAVDPAYYAELEHCIYQYNHMEPRNLLHHLVKHYTKIDNQMIKVITPASRKLLTSPNPSTSTSGSRNAANA